MLGGSPALGVSTLGSQVTALWAQWVAGPELQASLSPPRCLPSGAVEEA